MYKKFYSSHWFLKNQIFSLFPIVKMNPNHVEISRVGNLEPDFQQVILSVLKCLQHCFETSIIQIQQRKFKKKYFLRQKLRKSLYYRNCTGQTKFWP